MADNAGIDVTLSAGVRTLLMICKAFFVWKRLPTGTAAVDLLGGHCVLLHVSQEITFPSKGLLTAGAAVTPYGACCVRLNVSRKLMFLDETLRTDAALVRLLARVQLLVIYEPPFTSKRFVTDSADMPFKIHC